MEILNLLLSFYVNFKKKLCKYLSTKCSKIIKHYVKESNFTCEYNLQLWPS